MRLALAVVAIYSFSRTLAYVGPLSPDQRPAQLEFVDQSIPLWGYAAIWALGAALAVIAIWWRRLRPLAIGVNCGMNALWGLAFVLAWLFLDQQRSWVTGMSQLCIGALIICIGALKENRGPVVVVHGRD